MIITPLKYLSLEMASSGAQSPKLAPAKCFEEVSRRLQAMILFRCCAIALLCLSLNDAVRAAEAKEPRTPLPLPPAPTIVPGADIDEAKVRHVIHVAQAHPRAADANEGTTRAPLKTLKAAFNRTQKYLDAGEPTKIHIGPGHYRETLGHLVLADKARDTLLIIEGAGAESTIWSGSDVWAADKWQSLGNGLYAADWPHDWGNWANTWESPRVLGHRSEMVFVDGQLQRQKLLEEYDFDRSGTLIDHGNRKQAWTYKSFKQPAEVLSPGSFGVAERDENSNKIYLRLPQGKSINEVQVEVATRRQAFRMDGGERSIGKNNLVLRGLTFQRFASRTKENQGENTLALGNGSRNILIDKCRFEWNNAMGISIGASRSTIRDSAFNYNGFLGINGGMSHSLLENNTTNFNNWRGTWGGQKGWWLAGVKMHGTVNQVVRNHTAIGNLTTGFWYDIQCEHVVIDNMTSVANDADGLFIELSHGPFTISRLLSANNGGHAFASTIVGTFTLRDSILYANRNGTMRLRDERVPLPLAYLSWYQRGDEHASKYFGPGSFRLENNVLAGGPRQKNFVVEQNGLPLDDQRRITFRYRGTNNFFHSAARDGGFAFVDASRKPVQASIDGWQQRTVEAIPILGDPLFAAPADNDFRLKPGSPLAARAPRLPLKTIDPALLVAGKRFKAWAEAGLEPGNQ
jgi:hypothetical protein